MGDLRLFWVIYTAPFRKPGWWKAFPEADFPEARVRRIGRIAIFAVVATGIGINLVTLAVFAGWLPTAVIYPLAAFHMWAGWHVWMPKSKG